LKNYELWSLCMKSRLDKFVFTLQATPEKDYLATELNDMFQEYLKSYVQVDSEKRGCSENANICVVNLNTVGS
jgi:hypothetical protein